MAKLVLDLEIKKIDPVGISISFPIRVSMDVDEEEVGRIRVPINTKVNEAIQIPLGAVDAIDMKALILRRVGDKPDKFQVLINDQLNPMEVGSGLVLVGRLNTAKIFNDNPTDELIVEHYICD